jgi:alpha-tubulin suppressor-like RCC1 family protein
MLCTHARDGALSCVQPYFLDAFPSWNESQTRPDPDLLGMVGTAMPEVCLLRRDGSVECVRHPAGEYATWGDQHFRTDRVPLPAPAVAITSGWCAAVLLRDGRVATWCETNDEGYLQPDVTVHPDIEDAVAIDMGGATICVLRRSDAVTCWYAGEYPHFHMPEPRTITTLDHPTQIAVGDRHACALVADGRVQCWGGNEHGQLGNGSLDDADLDEDGSAPSLIPDTAPTWVVAPEPADASTPSP